MVAIVINQDNFPLYSLPRRLQKAVLALHYQVKAPIPICVISILGAASIACSAGHRVMRFNGLSSNIALFLLAIAASGERKTTCDKLASRALVEVEKMLHDRFNQETITFEAAFANWKTLRSGVSAALKRAAASGKDTFDLEARLTEIIAQKPAKPIPGSILINDITPEALIEHLANNLFAGLFSNEAGAIFSAKTMNNLGVLNIAWDGGSIRVNRKNQPPLIVDSATLTLCLMVQPEVLQKFLANKGDLGRSSGFLARILMCYPISTQGQRFEELTNFDYSTDLDEFHTWTKTLLLSAIDDSGCLKSQKEDLEFTPAAKERSRDYHNLIESHLQPIGQLTDVRDAASKIGENMSRLAAIFHLADDSLGDITIETTESAIAVSDYFLTEFKRLFGQVPQIPAWQTDAQNLWHKILNHVTRLNSYRIPKTLVRQCAPNNLRQKALLDSALNTLVNWGWVQVVKVNKTTYVDVFVQQQNPPFSAVPWY